MRSLILKTVLGFAGLLALAVFMAAALLWRQASIDRQAVTTRLAALEAMTPPPDRPVKPELQAWNNFGLIYREPHRVLRERAARTGSLLDIAAVRAHTLWCLGAASPAGYYEQNGVQLPERQRQLLAERSARCEGSMSPMREPVRDAAGYPGDPQVFLQVFHGGVKDWDERQRILAFVRETQSASLLQAVLTSLIDMRTPYELGVPDSWRYFPMNDWEMVLSVVALRACEERDDCAGDSALNPYCSLFKTCADDVRESVARQYLNSAWGQHVGMVYWLTLTGVTGNELHQRWRLVERLVHTHLL
jgi:hypothetical protein